MNEEEIFYLEKNDRYIPARYYGDNICLVNEDTAEKTMEKLVQNAESDKESVIVIFGGWIENTGFYKKDRQIMAQIMFLSRKLLIHDIIVRGKSNVQYNYYRAKENIKKIEFLHEFDNFVLWLCPYCNEANKTQQTFLTMCSSCMGECSG